MPDQLADERALITGLVDGNAGRWDLDGLIPEDLLRDLGARGLLCAQVKPSYGGLGLDSATNGELTAHTGSLCSSLRSVQTSQGMAAWAISRLGDADQRRTHLRALTSGQLAAVAFSEQDAGSDLSAMSTRIQRSGDSVVVDGAKKWITAARYADLLVVFGQYEDSAAAVVVPRSAPGVTVDVIADPLGCRAAGHANVRLDSVRLPAASLLGGGGHPLSLLVTTALTYGRMSVAWGCVGILRACLRAAVRHASSRKQFGTPLTGHQLVARHLADLFVAEQGATRACEHASRCWDSKSPEVATAAVLAKYVSSRNAATAAASAVQVLASAAAQDGHVVARAYRDAKLMEIIEGSTEICQLVLAEHAVTTTL
ncbi:acyl-CoA dehydrogenase family protein [Kibdelosporangium persicum]|uniref:Glutaryl-CoA dehydrogenase n=1 Tax=Kibdelosporangium persicum TaxID=2698649 RepID=A0ABX2F5F4_9PSEU|nr:acyl-CoA dehydrogenase family protein [Kibdelosporangium persicum]NRN66578.1 Glutaryl-CoA dehydrogenase [Kibdelosporangium persicum]